MFHEKRRIHSVQKKIFNPTPKKLDNAKFIAEIRQRQIQQQKHHLHAGLRANTLYDANETIIGMEYGLILFLLLSNTIHFDEQGSHHRKKQSENFERHLRNTAMQERHQPHHAKSAFSTSTFFKVDLVWNKPQSNTFDTVRPTKHKHR